MIQKGRDQKSFNMRGRKGREKGNYRGRALQDGEIKDINAKVGWT